jgi:hypothetical protein
MPVEKEAELKKTGGLPMTLGSLHAVVYDIETYPDDESIIELVPSNQILSVAVTYDEAEGLQTWHNEDVEDLVAYLKTFKTIIGFNLKAFDNVVLNEYEPGCLKDLNSKSLDLMLMVEKRLGHSVSLQSLIKPTLGISKTASGKLAMQWALDGEFEKVSEYCKQDVEATRDLFMHGLSKQELLYDYHGDIRKLKIDWFNPDKRFTPTEFTYSLYDAEKGEQITLDKDNKDFFHALELVRTTRQVLFITGKAGTGKTTFLKYVKSHVPKRAAIVAYTGVAAINAGGQTIHSFFKIDPKGAPFTPWDNRLRLKAPTDDHDRTTIYSHFQYTAERRAIIEALDLLIIDEVSMVRADIVDVIDKLLRAFSGKNRNLPFGGVQVVLIGDTFQLPPIEGDDWRILQEFYESPFFFSADVIKHNLPFQIELKKIYRQNELKFISLLNRIRINQPAAEDLALLNTKVRPVRNEDFDDNYIVLCSTNSQAKELNSERLQALPGIPLIFTGVVTGTFLENIRPTDIDLILKEGAQVMFLKNGAGYYNGKIGTIVGLTSTLITVQIKNSLGEVSEIDVQKYTWENVVYSYDRIKREIATDVIGTYTQYPLKLAWAITIHKSQGLAFEKVFVNINHFAPSGLAYVALSRCTSLNGLALAQPLQRRAINTDLRVIEFAQNIAPETLVAEALLAGKADALYSEAFEAYRDGMFSDAYDAFVKGIRHRNDIETPSFRKVILHILKRGRHNTILLEIHRDKFETDRVKFLDQLEAKDREMGAAVRKEATALKELAKKHNISYEHLEAKFNSVSTEKEALTKQRKILLEENSLLKAQLTARDKEVYNLQQRKGRLTADLLEVKQQLLGTHELLAICEQEVTRQSRISWLQKLCGKK